MSAVNLGANHVEYWKTAFRSRRYGGWFEFGFQWFATWPASRRLRWPIGRRTHDGLIGSVVTRPQVMHGGLVEEQTRALQMNVFERQGRLIGMKLIEGLTSIRGGQPIGNPRQGWNKYGERIV